ncbi:MAG: hypothetical protein HQK91_10305 [Nitrospirae bacterium]|nr:hypothetical protein [Nitrospirota bacterium]
MKKTTNKNSVIDTVIESAKTGDTGRITKWLDSNNDPNQYDKNGWTPLLWAYAEAI